ncbi:MAG: YbaB/EbfC family nucleoid-associated protein [Magnetococcales bacterium]|nr:YbaB/EbfC family nucleoid-associated protein [Magnetococcales bacterium]
MANFGGMGNIGNLMKQAQQMQGRLAKMQEELATQTVVGQSGGGMVEVTINGRQEVTRIKLEPTVVDPKEVEMLEDLITAACNDAQKKMADLTQRRMNEITGGMNIPGLNL